MIFRVIKKLDCLSILCGVHRRLKVGEGGFRLLDPERISISARAEYENARAKGNRYKKREGPACNSFHPCTSIKQLSAFIKCSTIIYFSIIECQVLSGYYQKQSVLAKKLPDLSSGGFVMRFLGITRCRGRRASSGARNAPSRYPRSSGRGRRRDPGTHG